MTYLVTQRRAEVLSQRGLRITGPGGTQIITPRLITPERLSALAGTVFIAVKAAALEAVIKEIGPAVGTPDHDRPHPQRHAAYGRAQHPGPAADSGCRADRKRASELSGAGFPVVISDDIPAAMWYK